MSSPFDWMGDFTDTGGGMFNEVPAVGNVDEFGNLIDNTGARSLQPGQSNTVGGNPNFNLPGGLPAGATSLIQKLISQGMTQENAIKLAGAVLPGVIGAIGANQQGNALQKIAEQGRTDRAQALSKFNQYLSDPKQK